VCVCVCVCVDYLLATNPAVSTPYAVDVSVYLNATITVNIRREQGCYQAVRGHLAI
jgi:hypothetical protein